MDEAIVVEHREFVGVVGGPGADERRDERRLPGEAATGQKQRPAIEPTTPARMKIRPGALSAMRVRSTLARWSSAMSRKTPCIT